ncbi:hypothetical protein SLS53_008716 [Cytospora paraplurivora]|uniref:Uncharacterized protein n=1 Tax=Cytospora paraplurivora TaxID=2898453 RepID=A0AAN9TXA3_9PEZI
MAATAAFEEKQRRYIYDRQQQKEHGPEQEEEQEEHSSQGSCADQEEGLYSDVNDGDGESGNGEGERDELEAARTPFPIWIQAQLSHDRLIRILEQAWRASFDALRPQTRSDNETLSDRLCWPSPLYYFLYFNGALTTRATLRAFKRLGFDAEDDDSQYSDFDELFGAICEARDARWLAWVKHRGRGHLLRDLTDRNFIPKDVTKTLARPSGSDRDGDRPEHMCGQELEEPRFELIEGADEPERQEDPEASAQEAHSRSEHPQVDGPVADEDEDEDEDEEELGRCRSEDLSRMRPQGELSPLAMSAHAAASTTTSPSLLSPPPHRIEGIDVHQAAQDQGHATITATATANDMPKSLQARSPRQGADTTSPAFGKRKRSGQIFDPLYDVSTSPSSPPQAQAQAQALGAADAASTYDGTADEAAPSLSPSPTKRARRRTNQLHDQESVEPIGPIETTQPHLPQPDPAVNIEQDGGDAAEHIADIDVGLSVEDRLTRSAQRLWSPLVLDEQLQILRDDKKELRDPLMNLISAFALAHRPDIIALDSTNLAWLSQGAGGDRKSARPAQQIGSRSPPAAILQVRAILELPDRSHQLPQIFFSYHKNHHWRALLIDIPKKTIAVADPLRPGLSPPQHFIESLEEDSGLLRALFGDSSSAELCSPSRWTSLSLDIPAQPPGDSINCGVFVLATALSLAVGQSPPKSLEPRIWRKLLRAMLEVEESVTVHSLLAEEDNHGRKLFEVLPEELCSESIPVPQPGQTIVDAVQALARFAGARGSDCERLQAHLAWLNTILEEVRRANSIISALLLAGPGSCTALEETARDIREQMEEREKHLASLRRISYFGWSETMEAQSATETQRVKSLLRAVERKHAALLGGHDRLKRLAAGVRDVIGELGTRAEACRAAHQAIMRLSAIST